jgi:hypothetical protein
MEVIARSVAVVNFVLTMLDPPREVVVISYHGASGKVYHNQEEDMSKLLSSNLNRMWKACRESNDMTLAVGAFLVLVDLIGFQNNLVPFDDVKLSVM